jgi:hypothetical protein
MKLGVARWMKDRDIEPGGDAGAGPGERREAYEASIGFLGADSIENGLARRHPQDGVWFFTT